MGRHLSPVTLKAEVELRGILTSCLLPLLHPLCSRLAATSEEGFLALELLICRTMEKSLNDCKRCVRNMFSFTFHQGLVFSKSCKLEELLKLITCEDLCIHFSQQHAAGWLLNGPEGKELD